MQRSYFAFEHRKEALLSQRDFIKRLVIACVWAVIPLGIWLIAGMIGHHWLAHLTWINTFLNALMIVGGMGPVDALTSSSSKLLAGFYAILSGVIFLSIFGLLLAPVYHRFLHRFHLDNEKLAQTPGRIYRIFLSFPRRRESTRFDLDPRLRGGDSMLFPFEIGFAMAQIGFGLALLFMLSTCRTTNNWVCFVKNTYLRISLPARLRRVSLIGLERISDVN